MSEGGVAPERDASPERSRYRLLLEITDLVARAKSLPDAFKELAAPVLALTGGELLNLSLHDPRRDCMLTHYWKRNQESGEFDVLPVDEAADRVGMETSGADRHSRYRARAALSRLRARVAQSRRAIVHRPSHEHALRAVLERLAWARAFPRCWNVEDIEFLSRVALMGALALEKERANRAFEEQQSLVAISRELSSSLELEKLLPVILSSLRSIARYERAVLSLLDEEGKNVHPYGDALEWEPFVNHGRCGSARAITLGAGDPDARGCIPHRATICAT